MALAGLKQLALVSSFNVWLNVSYEKSKTLSFSFISALNTIHE